MHAGPGRGRLTPTGHGRQVAAGTVKTTHHMPTVMKERRTPWLAVPIGAADAVLRLRTALPGRETKSPEFHRNLK